MVRVLTNGRTERKFDIKGVNEEVRKEGRLASKEGRNAGIKGGKEKKEGGKEG